jgi:hypothetical protein
MKVRKDSLKGGEKFGRLTVLEYSHTVIRDATHSERLMKCKCDCGKIYTVRTSSLKSGNCKSCGCLQKENIIKSNIKRGKENEILLSN